MSLPTAQLRLLSVSAFLFVLALTPVDAQRLRGSRTRTLEVLSTKAGSLKLVRIDEYDIGETNWFVVLGGKTIYRTHDDVFGSVAFHTVFKGLGSGEAVLIRETFNPGVCAAFRIITIPAKGKPTVSDTFGFCEPLLTQDGKRITFSFGNKPGVKPDAWIYENGILTKQ
jgi:hypothetical protein